MAKNAVKKPAKKPLKLDNFCYFPFMQLLLQPTGVVSPCCWNQEIVLGTVPEQELLEIWNGEPMRKLRREFLDGKPKLCAKQMSDIRCHEWSRRPYSDFLEITEVQSKGPRRLDVRLNGKCNLECVMCDVWKQPNGVYDNAGFWTKGPDEIFPHLLEVDVLGGEPFVQADTFKLLEAVSAVNSACSWAFVTNGNYKFSTPIIRRLDKVKIRWVQVSIDSIREETYSKIRLKGDLQKALSTLQGLQTYRRERAKIKQGFRLLLTMCVQKLNWREVGEIIRFAAAEEVELVLQFAYQPDSASLLTLPKQELDQVSSYFESLSGEFGESVLHPILLPVQERLARA